MAEKRMAEERTAESRRLDRIRGSLFGGAVGDALGYPVEFSWEEDIFPHYGEQGITAYEKDQRSGKALISDDTQMTLFTADGLLVGDTCAMVQGDRLPPRFYVAQAYQDWFTTQTQSRPGKRENYPDSVSWLLDVPQLYDLRAPGNTCMGSLWNQRSGKLEMTDDYLRDRQSRSKGCGGIMRVAPIALDYQMEDIGELDLEGAQLAAITHGDSLGFMPAAVQVHVINRIVYPPQGKEMSLREIVLEARDTMERIFAGDPHLQQLTEIIDCAVELADDPERYPDDLDSIHQLGKGWVAEETMAIALYCALRHQDDFSAGVIAAVNHSGDSDSTGAVTGNILGALLGYSAIEKKWKQDLELSDVILELADDLACSSSGTERGFAREKGRALSLDWERKYKM